MPTFLENKYSRWYFNIVQNAIGKSHDGYVEKHHVIPKSMSGTEVVRLTAREHFICHRLLVKMTEGKSRDKMLWALHRLMFSINKHQLRYVPTARTFERVRKEHAARLRKPRIITEEHRQNIAEANRKRLKGKTLSAEQCAKMSAAHKGLPGPNRGKIMSREQKEKIRASMLRNRKPSKQS